MSKTPTKIDTSHQFKPREITTPSKDHQGVSKVIFTHISKLHSLLTDWMKVKEKGIRLLRATSALKLHECMNDYYPSQLKQLMQSLLEALDSLKNVVVGIRILHDQIQALAQLQSNNEPVISTWSVTQIAKTITELYNSLVKEYKLKEVVTENVAHCRQEQQIELYISAWEFDVYLNIDLFAFLFVEFGLPGIC